MKAERPRDKKAEIATTTTPRGSLQRMVRRQVGNEATCPTTGKTYVRGVGCPCSDCKQRDAWLMGEQVSTAQISRSLSRQAGSTRPDKPRHVPVRKRHLLAEVLEPRTGAVVAYVVRPSREAIGW